MTENEKQTVLFLCTGNYYRSRFPDGPGMATTRVPSSTPTATASNGPCEESL